VEEDADERRTETDRNDWIKSNMSNDHDSRSRDEH